MSRTPLQIAQALLHEGERRVLDPTDRFGEILFGLIMTLTFTCSLSVADAGEGDTREVLVAALGCNIAWGLVDAVMYLVTGLVGRSRSRALLAAVQQTPDRDAVRRLIRAALPEQLGRVASAEMLDHLQEDLRRLPPPAGAPLPTAAEWRGALGIFLIVAVATLPVSLPFLIVRDPAVAIRMSNAVAGAMLFLAGWSLGRATDVRPALLGGAMILLGAALVGLTMALGG